VRPGGNRGWLLRLVIAFSFAQGAVSMARPAVSYRALALGADERAIGVIAGVYALLPCSPPYRSAAGPTTAGAPRCSRSASSS
jgi:hypothetical protein